MLPIEAYRQALMKRYASHRLKVGHCWLWYGEPIANGHCRMMVGGKHMHRIHRVAYELSRGPIPPRMCVGHSCANKKCWNPAT